MRPESLTDFPDASRLWVFGVDRPLKGDEEATLLGAVDAFLGDWRAHGTPLRAARDWRYGRFLIVSVDQRTEPPSGCSIDALVRVLKETGDFIGVTLVDNTPVWYRNPQGGVERSSRARFKQLAEAGEVSAETIVFDNSVTRLGDVRSGRWETRAGQSWHARAFPIVAGPSASGD